MKSTSPITWLALALSLVALVTSTLRDEGPSEDEIKRQVEVALVARERDQVKKLLPKVEQIYEDMLGADYTKPEKDPETFMELFRPMVEVIIGISPQ